MGTWYRTGTVAVTNGSPNIVGTGTLWLSQASVGDIFVGPDLALYEVTAITDDLNMAVKQLGGTAAYAGSTLSAQDYAIVRNFTSTLPAQLAASLAALMESYHVTLDELVAWLSGTGTVTVHDAVGNAYSVKTPAQLAAEWTGRLVKSVAGGAEVTLTTTEAGNLILEFIGTLTANINVIVPAASRMWIVKNGTAGAYMPTVKTAAGTGVAVAQGVITHLYCDATNVVPSISGVPGNFVVAGTITAAAISATSAVINHSSGYGLTISATDTVNQLRLIRTGSATADWRIYASGDVLTFADVAGPYGTQLNIGQTGVTIPGVGNIGTNIAAPDTGVSIANIVGSSTSGVHYYSTSGWGPNAANASIIMGKDNITGRSINAGGTINASGADYAEYERKAAGCGVIAKGQIIGFEELGRITDRWSAAISYGVKSTDPGLTGGDRWGTEEALRMRRPITPQLVPIQYTGPEKPPAISADAGDEDRAGYVVALNAWEAAQPAYLQELALANINYHADLAAYEIALANFNARLEAARQQVDRIAYSGKVPVNVAGAQSGDYIVAAEGLNDTIIGVIVTNAQMAANMGLMLNAVGRVRRILDDGRAEIAVIVH